VINEEKRKIQEEAFNALEANNFNGIVILPTGTGKTLVLINCLKALYKPGMRVLYACDSQMLRDGGFDEELVKWDAKEYCNIIEKGCYAGLYKRHGEYYDILLADEGDYALTPEYSKFFLNNSFGHIIFVSATLESKKRALAKQIVPIVYEKKIKEIEDKKVVNKANFILIPYLLNPSENRQYVAFNEKFTHLLRENDFTKSEKAKERIKKDLEFLSLQRIHFLAKLDSSAYICRKLLDYLKQKNPESKTLIFCGVTEQADRIAPSFHSGNEDDDNLRRFDDGNITELSVCGKVNRGKNLKSVNTIILENYNKSETLMVQRTGRGRRLDVDEMLDIYVLVPYYKKRRGKQLVNTPTIMWEWLKQAGKNLGIENAKTIYLK
jgi:superfamily II DNA or RNA helicase